MPAPTINEIRQTLIGQLQTQLNQTIPLLPRAFLRVLANALAGLFIILYKYGGFINLQLFVARASYDSTEINGQLIRPLLEWGRLVRVADPTAAEQAELQIGVTVTAIGGTLPSGSQLVSSDNGVTYITLAPVALSAASVVANVRAAGDQSGGNGAGSISNLPDGASLSFANPLAGVARTATVLSTVTAGADAETEASYRQRVINRFQRLPQGGAYADYDLWASEAANVANVYPYTGAVPGTVDVYIESSTEPDGIPTAAQLEAAYDQIWTPFRRPANAFARTRAITRSAFDVEIDGLATPNPGSVQVAIAEALGEYLLSREPFIVGLSVAPRRDRITEANLTAVVSDIVSADNGVFDGLTVSKDAAPIVTYQLGDGEKAKIGAITYV